MTLAWCPKEKRKTEMRNTKVSEKGPNVYGMMYSYLLGYCASCGTRQAKFLSYTKLPVTEEAMANYVPKSDKPKPIARVLTWKPGQPCDHCGGYVHIVDLEKRPMCIPCGRYQDVERGPGTVVDVPLGDVARVG